VKWYCALINVLSAVELHGGSLAVEVCDGGEKVGLRIALLCLLGCYPDICPNQIITYHRCYRFLEDLMKSHGVRQCMCASDKEARCLVLDVMRCVLLLDAVEGGLYLLEMLEVLVVLKVLVLLEAMRHVLLCTLGAVEGEPCLLEVPEAMLCVLLCMLEAVEDELCLLVVFEVLEVPKVILCVLLCMLEAVEDRICLLMVLEVLEVMRLEVMRRVLEVMRRVLAVMRRAQVVQAMQVAQTTQQKKCGRYVGSKDKQSRKKRAKKADLVDEGEQNTA